MSAGIAQNHNHMAAPAGEIAYQSCPYCEPLIEELARRYGDVVDATVEPEFETTDRGFKHLAPIKGWRNQDLIRVYESSNAQHPCIRVAVDETNTSTHHNIAHIQLTIEAAAALRDQLDWLITNHYQEH